MGKYLGVNQLKEELLNQELTFTDLDNYMVQYGYYSVFDDGVTEDIKEGCNVAYLVNDPESEDQVLISFEILIDNGEDEAEEAFTLKVTDISEL